MNLTYYPYEPFQFKGNEITVLDIGSSKVYFDICRGFMDSTDSIHISNDDLELQNCSSVCSWYGDPLLSVDLNKLFLRKIQQHLLQLLTDEQQAALIDKGQELVTKVTDASFMLDLPLEISAMPDIDKIMKFGGMSFPAELTGNPYAILETLIRTHVELGLKKSVVLTNVSHYLDKQDFNHLNQLVHELGVTVLIIEFSELNRKVKFDNACYYYVDEDFVDFRRIE